MSLISKRLVGVAASALLLSCISTAANAQSDVLTGGFVSYGGHLQTVTATYTFNTSMILNSVGFVSNGKGFRSFGYSIDGVSQVFNAGDVAAEVDGIRWLTLINPTTVNATQVLTVTTAGDQPFFSNFTTFTKGFSGADVSTNVTFGGVNTVGSDPYWSNSNLRVSASNPGSNVAPEPGSFALALTGGAALLGICIRRRRNAG